MPPRKNSRKKRPAPSYPSSDHDDKNDSTKSKKKTLLKVPKKKLKKSTEERIKQVVGDDDDSQIKEEEDENNDMMMLDDKEGDDDNIDSRSKKAKRMDWEQGFFYLPKFDCYLPRHILHMILEFIPPFPYLLNIRSISLQWLDDFDTVVSQNVKELDLVKRNDIDYETVKYNYPWYDSSVDTKQNNDSIRFLAILFPNIEKLIVPAIGAKVYVPNNILKLFDKLETMQIFYVTPITLDDSYKTGERPLTYQQDITNIQLITESEYLSRFCSNLVLVYDSDYSELRKVSNCLIPNNVISLFKYLVREQHFSLKRLNILSLPKILYSKAMIEFILEENTKQLERGYGLPTLTYQSQILHIEDQEIIDYMIEKQFFKNLLPAEHINSYDWNFISKILQHINNPKVFKMLFEQADFPLVFDKEMNPLLWFINNNQSKHDEIIEFLCTLNPSLIIIGNENGIVNGDEKNLKILELYIRTCKHTIREKVISSLIKAGSVINFVCPSTGDNLIHIHPYSPALIDAVSVEYLQMKNNEGNNALENLVQPSKINTEYYKDRLAITFEGFGKAYSKFGLSLKDVKFEKNQNLLHKLINLTNDTKGIITNLIHFDVDANAIDEDGNLPLFYYLNKKGPENRSDGDFKALINSISEETLTRQFDNKSLLTNIIERLDSDISRYASHSNGSIFSNINILDLIENLLSRGCNLNQAISELSDGYYEKGNLDQNKSLFLMQLLHSGNISNLEKLRKIFKYFDNFEELLTKACTINGTPISPLLYVISFWASDVNIYDHSYEINAIFFSEDNRLISEKLLENIIDISPTKKIDALYFSIISCKRYSLNSHYLEGILGIKPPIHAGWWSRSVNTVEIAKRLALYRYQDEVYGKLNVIHLAVITQKMDVLQKVNEIFTYSLKALDDLYAEPFKNGTSILDELVMRDLLPSDTYFTKEKWTSKHFRLAFEASSFQFCYLGISGSYAHDFTKEEILQILIGEMTGRDLFNRDKNGQMKIATLIESHFSDLTHEEKFKLFSRRFKIVVNNKVGLLDTSREFGYRNGWQKILETALFDSKSLSSFDQKTLEKKEEYHLSLLDLCYWKGYIYLVYYLVLEDSNGRKKKNILVNSDLKKDILLSWITNQCDHTGKTIIHFACQKSDDLDHSDKIDLIHDLVSYLSNFDRQDALNIQDNELRTPAFYSLKSELCTDLIFSVSDLTLKNNKGETVQDLMNDEEKENFSEFFEKKKKKKETKPKKKTTRKKKQESDDSEEEEKPKRNTRVSTKRKK